jgi:hypothetical protein
VTTASGYLVALTDIVGVIASRMVMKMISDFFFIHLPP